MTEAGFKECLGRGGKLLIVCTEKARSGRDNFQGGWQFYPPQSEDE